MQTQALQLRTYGYIYKITNPINNKCYIGQTVNHPKYRWNNYKNLRCNDQPKLYNALKKYGPDNFTYEIVITGFNQNNLDFLEDTYEVWCNSIKNGYNIKRGGSNGKHSEETKLKISKSHIGIKPSEEHKQKISKSLKDIYKQTKHPFYGKRHSKETKQKLSILRAGSQKGIKNNMFGRKHSEETKLEMCRTRIGRKHTEATKLKMSATRRQKFKS